MNADLVDHYGTDGAVRAARLVERDPLLINASAHLIAFAHR